MIKIYTVSDKRPDFIELQYNSFKTFLKDKQYEFIICNNGSTPKLKEEIEQNALAFNIKTLHVEGKYENGAIATQVPLIYCLKNYIQKDDKNGISVIIDSDIFLFAPVSFRQLLNGGDIAGIYQQRDRQQKKIFFKTHYYLWNALLILNNATIHFHDFDLSLIQNITDVGGNTHYYIEKYNPKINWLLHTADIDEKEMEIFVDTLRDEYKPDFGMQVIEKSFIHYYRGSNWDNSINDYHLKKTNFLRKLLHMASNNQNPINDKIKLHESNCAHSQKHFNGTRQNHKYSFKISNNKYRLKWF